MEESSLIPYSSVTSLGAGPILVLAPHPDDEVFGCAGAIMRQLAAGEEAVRVVVLTDGGNLGEDEPGRQLRDEYAATRRAESVRAAEILGYGRPEFWNLPDRGLRYGEHLVERILEAIRETKPNLVFAPSPDELHPDHRATALSATEAVWRYGKGRIVYYEVSAPLQPSRLLDISDLMARKREAMRCFASQLERQDYARQVEALNAFRTYTLPLGTMAAEGYRVVDAPDLDHAFHENLTTPCGHRPPRDGEGLSAPLVSVIVRSMGRNELDKALNSIALQTWPHIEIVLVNARGEGHPPVPEWCGDFPLRVIGGATPLRRSAAANAGLLAASGEFVAFLDDDDWWLPDHIAVLAEALADQPGNRAAYSGVRCVVREGGKWRQVYAFNSPFDATRLYYENYLPMHSVLFSKALVDEGCRFDETLDTYEDWDFWLQVTRRTDFTHVDRFTAFYRLGAGSGFGVTASESAIREAEDRFLAKWRSTWTADELHRLIQRLRNPSPDCAERGQPVKETALPTLQSLIEKQASTLADLRRENADLTHELGAIDNHAAQLAQALEDAMRTVDSMRCSTSWRITAPVRATRMLLSGIAGRGLVVRFLKNPTVRSVWRRLPVPASHRQRIRCRLHRRYGVHLQAGSDLREDIAPPVLLRVGPGTERDYARNLALPLAENPVVSVIVPVYNHAALTLECLGSIAQHGARAPFEVIVADDGSTDGTREILREVRGIRLVENPENLGFLRSCNHAAESARGEYLLFLNNDTQVTEGWLDALLDALASDPDAGIAGSKLVFPDGRLQEAGAILDADGRARLVGWEGNPADPRFSTRRRVDYCSGACLMISKSLYEQVGGFSERYAPAYYEDSDLAFKIRTQGRHAIYEPASTVIHHMSITTGEVQERKLAQSDISRGKFIQAWGEELDRLNRVRLIAFYLPQFHPIPENDEWWGKGFTEWHNVAKAHPNFEGHYQPHLPADLGFYDLRVPEVREQQAELAAAAGIHGFCYYHYWFNGRRLLQRPFEEVLASGQPDFPFCVCWANENWTRRWDGLESEILLAQSHSPEDDRAFIRALFPALRDPRYIRIDGRPLLLVYRPSLLPRSAATTEIWRTECRAAGIEDPYLVCVQSFQHARAADFGFDAVAEFPPHTAVSLAEPPGSLLNADFRGEFYDHVATAREFMARGYPGDKVFRGVMPSWDNTARRQDAAHIFLGSSPEVYEQWLRQAIAETRDLKFGDERIVFINAWNEWAEGCHLEPDRRYGHQYLDATRRALESVTGPVSGKGMNP